MIRFAYRFMGAAAGAFLTLAAQTAAAAPQDLSSSGQAARPAQAQSGPLLLQPVSSGFVFTPEVRFTPVNHSTGTMVGASAGWLLDDTFLLGGAAYWLTNGVNGTDMWYGGLVAGWMVPLGNAVRVGGRGLVGWGDASIPYQYAYPAYDHGQHHVPAGNYWSWASTSFFVFEPEATATIRLTRSVSFDIGGGYRVIGDAYGLDHELRGGFGSIGVRFGPF